ncbi:hypothetical protein E2C01_005169 [Portunus trituberculatus]|uniref:Uncharacterized protein n=1 Tax=Portunus trituberculatus TaxID=210409 RepID=A0A5B7CUF8_PORTR|nr:hypothetical protein [Portunus trituberculatus]
MARLTTPTSTSAPPHLETPYSHTTPNRPQWMASVKALQPGSHSRWLDKQSEEGSHALGLAVLLFYTSDVV